jgi:hypothetical protein
MVFSLNRSQQIMGPFKRALESLNVNAKLYFLFRADSMEHVVIPSED